MNIAVRLRELGRNLYWTWHPEVIEIFRAIDPSLVAGRPSQPGPFPLADPCRRGPDDLTVADRLRRPLQRSLP